MKKSGIKIKGYKGTWYVLASCIHDGEKLYLLENETWGDEAACLIVDGDLNVIAKDVWNGFGDLEKKEGNISE